MEHPYLDPRFAIAWSTLSPDHIAPDIKEALRRSEEKLAAIAAQDPAKATWESAFLALENASDELDFAWGKIAHLESVAFSPQLREAYNAMLPAVTDFYAQIYLRNDLWAVLREVANRVDPSQLEPVHRRYLDETLKNFRENGADRPPEKKARLRAVTSELARLTQRFSENVLDSTNAGEVIVDQEGKLSGLPESAKTAAFQSACEAGYNKTGAKRWRFTLHAPSFLPAMRHLHDVGIRKALWQCVAEIGLRDPWDNTGLIRQILAARAEKVALLGREDFADLVLERRMARSGANALAFLERLHDQVKPLFDRENDDLETFKAEATNTERAPLQPWDALYWSEKLRKHRFAYDEEELRPYFAIDNVIEGLFDIASTLFGITISEQPGLFRSDDSHRVESLGPSADDANASPLEVWHPAVKVYAIHDPNGRHLGSFYADWYPRASKRSGAWMNYLFTSVPDRETGQRGPHLGLIAGNLTPPVGKKSALLDHYDVQVIFHEFGHLLHHLLGDVPIRSLNGVNVAWDFVELPSQLLENWCWAREGLNRFARHHETGEPIPDDLYRRMIAARNFQSARFTMRQLAFSRLDLVLHQRYASRVAHEANHAGQPPEPVDLDATADDILAGYQPPLQTQPSTIARSFSHLFSDPTGYAAGYYSYKWAEVLDADAFSRFELEGTLNPATGMDFREKILSRGNSEPPEDLFRSFMGRDPDETALLRRSGLFREKAASA